MTCDLLKVLYHVSSTEGFSCVPTKFDSALVETPNKVEVMQTVVSCELKESCYRVPYVEYYYETVHHEDGVKEERLKVCKPKHCIRATDFIHKLHILT